MLNLITLLFQQEAKTSHLILTETPERIYCKEFRTFINQIADFQRSPSAHIFLFLNYFCLGLFLFILFQLGTLYR